MDKYEFNIKVEQIKKMVARSDYETAMKIADTIDWRRVRNINLLSMAATIYEKNEEYQEAKDILLLAFERAPIGKRLLYKLADLAIKEGSLREAEDYYREFCDLAPDDPRQYILRYLILGAKGAPVEQLIHTLEQYCNLELDEKWLYKLAELYSQAGLDDLCIMACDKIMLMFGLGKYVDKAMELKIQLAPLTKYQMDLVENRDKYEAKLKAVEQEYRMGGLAEYEKEGLGAELDSYYKKPSFNAHEESAYTRERGYNAGGKAEYLRNSENKGEKEYHGGFEEEYQNEYNDKVEESGEIEGSYQDEEQYQESYKEQGDELSESPRLTIEPEELEEERKEPSRHMFQDSVPPPVVSDEVLKARIHEAEVQANLAMEMSRLSGKEEFRQDLEIAQTRVLTDIRNIKRGAATPASCRIMIEAQTQEQGLKEAVNCLKKLHKETGSKNQAAKITGEKLNIKGVFAVADKLTGKDLIVEQAGVMVESTLQELNQLIARDETGMNVVLIDTAQGMEELYRAFPGFARQFELIKVEAAVREESQAGPEDDKRPVRHIEINRENAGRPIPLKMEAEPKGQRPQTQRPAAGGMVSGPVAEGLPGLKSGIEPVRQAERKPAPTSRPAPVEARSRQVSALPKGTPVHKIYEEELPSTEIPSETEDSEYENEPEEMDIDEFAKYACKYAGEIDCSISGKSMLALYERIEIMEEDGIPLTEDNAEDLIEEAADRAENPSLFKRFVGIFSSKYDKQGLLILKEEHFI